MEVQRGTTISAIAASIGQRLSGNAIAANVDGTLVDLSYPVNKNAAINIITIQDPAAHQILLHSTAHLMAHAIKNLFPDSKIAIGPALEDRFYYDIELETPITAEQFPEIEREMKRLSDADYPVERVELSRQEALELFSARNEDYKVEIIESVDAGDSISAYRQNDFIDLCRGPHVPTTGKLKHFRLLSTSGAYWRGDENNKMLQRIYGTSWQDKQGLTDYLHRREEAKSRDHRKLGKELGLFSFHAEAPASPFFLPKGTIVYRQLQTFIGSLYRKYGYQEVITPQIFHVDLWKKSGHWEHYRENLYLTAAGKGDEKAPAYGLKPMNCPGDALIYAERLRSYRELPLRLADFGRLHRYERGGVVAGLTRVRTFSIDDAHIFCTADQIGAEIRSLFEMVREVYEVFGFEDVEIKLSTRPEQFMGDPALWSKAETILARSLEEAGLDYRVDPGEGAFYGPKIDFDFRDALKRKWQLTTIQLDFSLPERMQLKYIDEKSQEQQPVMIHRAILGSIERFMGIYLEHTAGDFPLWLAPLQVLVVPISERFQAYARQVTDKLLQAGLRAELDDRDEKVGAKIRQAEIQKVPVMLIVGEREERSEKVSLRRRPDGDLGAMELDELIAQLDQEIANKTRRSAHSQR